jgi:Na+-translocating ferredoxin:NAD+ oxidoreductase RnfC subunit
MLNKIRNAGIAGGGGAGFPAYFKLNSKPDLFICNAAECEPLLYTDYYYIENHIDKVIGGMAIAMQITGAKKGYFAIKKKRKNLFKKIEDAIKNTNANISIFEMEDYYPAGDEQSLVFDVTGRIVPQKGLPIDVSVVVNNVATLLQIFEAVKQNKPVTERYVSVVGRVKNRFVANVKIGTPFSELVKLAQPERGTVLIEGGVMMGTVKDEKAVVTKTTGAIVFLERDNAAVREKVSDFQSVTRLSKAACCQCTECTVLCPRYNLGHDIEPHMIMRTLNYGLNSDSHVAQAAMLCCQCGICSMFSCPFGLSPKRVYADFRKRLKKYDIPAKEHKANEFNRQKKLASSRLKAKLGIKNIDLKPEFIGDLNYNGDLKIELRQHIGQIATPVVKVGQTIMQNQVVGDVEKDKLGLPVHSPVAGIVREITNNYILIGQNNG